MLGSSFTIKVFLFRVLLFDLYLDINLISKVGSDIFKKGSNL